MGIEKNIKPNNFAIITGASKGLGKAISELFIKNGTSVILCARNKENLDKTILELENLKTDPQQIIASYPLDISNYEEIDNFVSEISVKFPQINILVNNAGIHGPLGDFEENDWNSWINTINTNLFGAIYLCKKLIPLFKKNKRSKIINLSGGGATSSLPKMSAYAISKVALVRFTEILADELMEYGIDVNAVAPGAMLTDLNKDVIKQGEKAVGKEYYEKITKLLKDGGTPLTIPAELTLYLSSPQSDGITGRLISANWDCWQKLSQHKEELLQSDIYTLRRIIPEDRNKKWD